MNYWFNHRKFVTAFVEIYNLSRLIFVASNFHKNFWINEVHFNLQYSFIILITTLSYTKYVELFDTAVIESFVYWAWKNPNFLAMHCDVNSCRLLQWSKSLWNGDEQVLLHLLKELISCLGTYINFRGYCLPTSDRVKWFVRSSCATLLW